MASEVQTVIFAKDVSPTDINDGKGWSKAQARNWLDSHELRSSKADETERSFRFRQFDPSECSDGTMTSLTRGFPRGITAVACDKARCVVQPVVDLAAVTAMMEDLSIGHRDYVHERLDAYEVQGVGHRDLPSGGRVAQIERALPAVLRILDPATRTVEVLASDRTLDRYGDTIDPLGWDTASYRRNPVVLADHDYNIDKILGVSLGETVTEHALVVRHRFLPPGVNELADKAWAMISAGALRAVSVGFLSIDRERRLSEDGAWAGGIDFLKQELLEVSWVAVPANPSAVIGNSKGSPAGRQGPSDNEVLDRVTARVIAQRLKG